MPHIFVQHVAIYGEDFPELLKRFPEEVLPEVASLLAVESWPLTKDDFSVTYRQKDGPRYEILTAHFQILIFAHAFPERVRDQDQISEKIAQVVARWLENFDWKHPPEEPIDISVSLILAEIGYKSVTIFDD